MRLVGVGAGGVEGVRGRPLAPFRAVAVSTARCGWDAGLSGPAADGLSGSGAGFDDVDLWHPVFERVHDGSAESVVCVGEPFVSRCGCADLRQGVIAHGTSMA